VEMDSELATIAQQIERVHSPEEVFGVLRGQPDEQLRAAKIVFHSLSKVIHPDRYTILGDKQVAHRTMAQLNALWAEARHKISAGGYGYGSTVGPTVWVRMRQRDYQVGSLLSADEVCNLYQCQFKLKGSTHLSVFKIAHIPEDNDLVATEAQVLRQLRGERKLERLFPFVPEVHDSFLYADEITAPRQANVLAQLENGYSLEEVRGYYSAGLDPRDVAWMWRKLLIALGFAHVQGIIHGAVLPPHILIQPDEHGLVLNNWVYGIREPGLTRVHLQAIVAAYESWYPPEVYARQPLTPSFDIYMSARCMVYLLGGDPGTGELPNSVPAALVAFLRGCLLQAPARRPQRAWELLNEFTQLIERLWGPRTFRPFRLPAR
jgi:serine/threonine protein kinase